MRALVGRITAVEGRVEEQVRMTDAIQKSVADLETRMETRFEAVDRRFDAIDRRFEAIDRRFEAVDRRFETVDRRFDSVDRRIDNLDHKVSRHFVWQVGLQVTTLAAMVAALAAIAAK